MVSLNSLVGTSDFLPAGRCRVNINCAVHGHMTLSAPTNDEVTVTIQIKTPRVYHMRVCRSA